EGAINIPVGLGNVRSRPVGASRVTTVESMSVPLRLREGLGTNRAEEGDDSFLGSTAVSGARPDRAWHGSGAEEELHVRGAQAGDLVFRFGEDPVGPGARVHCIDAEIVEHRLKQAAIEQEVVTVSPVGGE